MFPIVSLPDSNYCAPLVSTIKLLLAPPNSNIFLISPLQGLCRGSEQHCEGPHGLQMDPDPAALLRDGPQAAVLPLTGVLHGSVSHQHHDQSRYPGRL